MSKLTLSINGMTCAACVKRLETVLGKVPGVSNARVNLAARRASIEAAETLITPGFESELLSAVKKAGFEGAVESSAQTPQSLQSRNDLEVHKIRRQTLVALLLTTPVFIMEMGGHLIAGFHQALLSVIPVTVQHIAQALLTTLVLAWPGQSFFRQGFAALLRGHPEMNSLVALGAGSAWLYSMVVLVSPSVVPEVARHVYFEAAAVIVTLILLGRLFEARARGRTSAAIEQLIGLQPRTARRINQSLSGNSESDVAIEHIVPGDLLRVRPGEKVPVDGIVVEGEPYIDMAMISGEPIPAQLRPGERVAGGTVNTTVSFTFRATHTGADTVLAHIIRMVQATQDTKLPIQAVVDRVTAVFVPVIIAIALVTFVVWSFLTSEISTALVNAVAVLIIACPCAMGLATPTSIMVGTGRAAQLGVLFRRGDALQQLKHVTHVAFDKTGTLTQGHPALTHIEALRTPDLPQLDEILLLRIVAALQSQSEHPIARAIMQAANLHTNHQPSLKATEFEAIKGLGVKATVVINGHPYAIAVGSKELMQIIASRQEQDCLSEADMTLIDKKVQALARQGHTPLHVAINQRLVGLMAVADPVKPDAQETVLKLKQRGIACVMITGDHSLTARAIADAVGIEQIHAQVKPEGKVEVIRSLMGPGKTVAFVGDGINDAPALAAADIGVAIGTGTDVAIETACVVLMSGRLNKVVTAIDLSKATLANIHQNLFWAFAYNAALVPVAAGLLYPINGTLLSPILAAGAMAASSLFVVGNALRLRLFKTADS